MRDKMKNKVQKCLTERMYFSTCYETKKLAMFCSTKHTIITQQNSNVIYCLTCPGCNENYIGNTDRNLATGLHEHGSRNDQPMHQRLLKCKHFIDIVKLIPRVLS